MERLLMKELASTSVSPAGGSGGGCISQGAGYLTDNYGHVFVKQNKKSGAATMFMGELEGLKALEGTGCIRVPKPIKVFPMPDGGAAIIVEHVHIKPLSPTCEAEAGTNLARLHLHNRELKEKAESSGDGNSLRYVAEFGFSTTTCCGYIPQDNTWTDDWVTFFTQRRLELQVNLAVKKYHDQELLHQWTAMKPKIPSFFKGIVVQPSLLHGDLWGGNIGQTAKGEPIVFDPAVFYGHDEYDLGISSMFGGFGKSFFDAYHKLIPRTEGFDVRQELYKLFHYLNHYNHFGSSYRGSCMKILKNLAR
ncbi:hypothetical protein RvY_13632-2 [Ramazzottius varieornatus]|uniref:protein-ribulosamine 3-kinase n=1 Tax=Ramazzottius varieornatus TaxID=947166 RepID=A0A1D1VVZ9_RAMVA|nr:hypothetical protein RvY_13632-2 [Ramazzottius varieornatus]